MPLSVDDEEFQNEELIFGTYLGGSLLYAIPDVAYADYGVF